MIRPFRGKVLLFIYPYEDTSAGGIFIPEDARGGSVLEKSKPRRARVMAVGEWKTIQKDGKIFHILPDFKQGDLVIVSDYAGTKMSRGVDENLRLCGIDDVLAILEEESNTA
jgi:co-chaperonin GroES (HSP10)